LKAANIGVMGKRELKLQKKPQILFYWWWLIKNDYRGSRDVAYILILKKQYVISFPFIFPSY
jgi:hypothetical protein